MSGNGINGLMNPCHILRSNKSTFKEEPKMPSTTEPAARSDNDDSCSDQCLPATDNMNKSTKAVTSSSISFPFKPTFMNWSMKDLFHVLHCHPIPCALTISLLFFMGVEYTLSMVPPSSPPFDVGFRLTQRLHRQLASRPSLNTLLAGLNTVFVGMQTTYILWTCLVEGRSRATISALFMFTCRGILGYTTQLPLPQEFLGSGVDFPVGNVSFFLFFSGHVAGSVIASLDMRRMQRHRMAWSFDMLNLLQMVRLLVTRGHYTIDLAVGVGAGVLFDSLAGKYQESKKLAYNLYNPTAD